jgi:anti-sigma factor RsiW
MTAPLCDPFRNRFDDYHDGLLSAALAESVRSHLTACDTCREEYGLLVSCIGVIRGLDAPAVPPRALRRIIDTLSDPGDGTPLPDRLEPGLDTP